MRLNIERTGAFKRDYKRLKKKHYDMDKLRTVIQLIVDKQTDTLYHQYNDHALVGELKGYRECHIEKDWLLMYKIESSRLTLVLTRTGSHKELFSNQS